MIELKNLQVKYDDFIAIDNINLTIQDGEFFTLLGPSGCGKTTTLRTIAGFNEPSQGSIIIDGQDVTKVPVEQRGLGMVFQSYALFPTMTVYDNIAYGLRVDKLPKSEVDTRVKELARLVELNEDQLQKNVSALSGGQQQRVAIARALAKNPKIVLFDEPLSNLDAKLRKQLRAELKRIQRETGMTAIYVTHDQEEALVMSDHIAVFNNGRIDQVGTPKEIYEQSGTEFVCNFIGDANPLGRELMSVIHGQSRSRSFDLNKRHYLRDEKVRLWRATEEGETVAVKAKVLEERFYGTFSTYICRVHDTVLRIIEKKDGNRTMFEDQELTLYIHPQDILEYGVSV